MKRVNKQKVWSLFALLVFVGSTAAGCISMTSWAHNKRHVKQVWHELHDLHEDFDRIVFGLERNPAE
jgi:hypothetical protein